MQITGGYRDGYPRHQKIEKSGQNTAIRNNDSKVRQQTNPHLVNEVKMPLARIQPLLTYCKGQAGRGGADTKRGSRTQKILYNAMRSLPLRGDPHTIRTSWSIVAHRSWGLRWKDPASWVWRFHAPLRRLPNGVLPWTAPQTF